MNRLGLILLCLTIVMAFGADAPPAVTAGSNVTVPVASKPQDPISAAPKPEDPKPAAPKTQDPKPATPKPQEPKPATPKPQEPKPAAPKHQDPKPAAPKGDEWTLVFADEFNAPIIDRKKWSFEQGNGPDGWGNHELEHYTDRPANAYIEKGNLVLRAVKEKMGGAQYTSARMHTLGHFSTMYGKFEMRAKLPNGQGIWPGFWLLGSNVKTHKWPACGEIDIMEVIGREPNNLHASTHAPGFDTTTSFNHPQGFKNDFHTYGTIWDKEKIEFTFDGKVYKTVTRKDMKAGGVWAFDNPMHIILNLAVGGDWAKAPDATTPWPAYFFIDWVRVHQLKKK